MKKNTPVVFFSHNKIYLMFFSSFFCSTSVRLGVTFTLCNFLASRLRRFRSFSFSFGQVMDAAFIAVRCATCSFLARDNFFRVFSTWANQSLRNVVIMILILIKKTEINNNHIVPNHFGGANLSFSPIRAKFDAIP